MATLEIRRAGDPVLKKQCQAVEKVTGKIKNVVDFGAFVDIGLHETGLIHVSELSDSFVSDPMEVVKVGDIFEFTILANGHVLCFHWFRTHGLFYGSSSKNDAITQRLTC